MIVSESIIRDGLRLVVWYPLRWLLLMVPAGLALSILRLLGDIHYALSRKKRAQILNNFKRLNPDSGMTHCADVRQVIREYFRNHYIDHLMIFIFPKLGQREIEKMVEFEGLAHLNHALDANKGAILIHGHFGPVHLPLVCLSRLGYPMMQIGMPSDQGISKIGKLISFRLRMRYEAKMPAVIIHARTFMRPVIRWLQNNGVIMVTGDGSGTSEKAGRYDTFLFLNHRVDFPLGPALLSRHAGSSLLPLFIVPAKEKKYRIVIEPPISDGETDPDPHVTMQKFIDRFELYVRQWPGYMHFLDRFEPGQWIESEMQDGC